MCMMAPIMRMKTIPRMTTPFARCWFRIWPIPGATKAEQMGERIYLRIIRVSVKHGAEAAIIEVRLRRHYPWRASGPDFRRSPGSGDNLSENTYYRERPTYCQ